MQLNTFTSVHFTDIWMTLLKLLRKNLYNYGASLFIEAYFGSIWMDDDDDDDHNYDEDNSQH